MRYLAEEADQIGGQHFERHFGCRQRPRRLQGYLAHKKPLPPYHHRSVGWLIGWFVGLLVCWLVGWLVGWFIGWLVGWLVG